MNCQKEFFVKGENFERLINTGEALYNIAGSQQAELLNGEYLVNTIESLFHKLIEVIRVTTRDHLKIETTSNKRFGEAMTY